MDGQGHQTARNDFEITNLDNSKSWIRSLTDVQRTGILNKTYPIQKGRNGINYLEKEADLLRASYGNLNTLKAAYRARTRKAKSSSSFVTFLLYITLLIIALGFSFYMYHLNLFSVLELVGLFAILTFVIVNAASIMGITMMGMFFFFNFKAPFFIV